MRFCDKRVLTGLVVISLIGSMLFQYSFGTMQVEAATLFKEAVKTGDKNKTWQFILLGVGAIVITIVCLVMGIISKKRNAGKNLKSESNQKETEKEIEK